MSGSGQRASGMRLLQCEERTNYPLTLSVDDWARGSG